MMKIIMFLDIINHVKVLMVLSVIKVLMLLRVPQALKVFKLLTVKSVRKPLFEIFTQSIDSVYDSFNDCCCCCCCCCPLSSFSSPFVGAYLWSFSGHF